MPTSAILSEQLATVGVNLPVWPEDPEDGGSIGEWIQLGQAYAEAVRLWRAQLRNAPDSIQANCRKVMRDQAESGLLETWDFWVLLTILPAIGEPDVDSEWAMKATAHGTTLMTPPQTLGSILEGTREAWLSATEGLEYMIDLGIFPRAQTPTIASLLIEEESASDCYSPDDRCEHETWATEIQKQRNRIQILIASLELTEESINESVPSEAAQAIVEKIKCLCKQIDSCSHLSKHRPGSLVLRENIALQHISAGRKKEGLKIFENAINKIPMEIPENINKNAWKQLMINSVANRMQDTGRILLVESKSLPRSGHHYLKSALQAAAPDRFSYCEFYQEPGCCMQTPCNAEPHWCYARDREIGHVRLVKSHDFALEDPTYETPSSVIRLIQVRQPMNLLASWIELEQLNLNRDLLAIHGISLERTWLYHEKELLHSAYALLDEHGIVMQREEAAAWLTEKSDFVIKFAEKWVPLCLPITELESQSSGTYLVNYEDLGEATQNISLQLYGLDNCEITSNRQPIFNPRSSATQNRRSTKLKLLLEEIGSELLQAEKTILTEWNKLELLAHYK